MVNESGVTYRRARTYRKEVVNEESSTSNIDEINMDKYYNTAAASEAFNNAPKICNVIPPLRSARSKSRNREGRETETDEDYDERRLLNI